MSEIANKAQELLQGRVSSVEELDAALTDLNRLKDQVTESEKRVAAAWSAATAAGWSPGELKQLGLSQPSPRRGGRPRGSGAMRPRKPTPGAAD